jgi:nucleoid-associated protein YgaU
VRYTIQKGDTLYDIAIDHYGAGRYWTRIRDANPGIDPNRLKVGQIILLPPEQDQATGPAGGATRGETGTRGTPPEGRGLTYVVGQGDTLTDIARNILGDGSRWREIYELNQDKLESPDVIPIGIELRLPPIEKKNQP